LNKEQNKEKMAKQYDQYSGVFFFIKIKRLDISIYKNIFLDLFGRSKKTRMIDTKIVS